MSCEQAGRQIERMIEDSELKEIERTLLFGHIRACPHCKSELQRRRRLELKLKETFAAIDTRADFNQRLMAALPDTDYKFVPQEMPGATSVSSAKTARMSQASGRIPSNSAVLWLWRWRVALGVAAMVCIGLIGMFFRTSFVTLKSSDKPPVVVRVSGRPFFAVRKGVEEPPFNERVLMPKDAISAGEIASTIKVLFGEQWVADVTLEPGAQLTADNRHVYHLQSGSAHFVVNPKRPQDPGEFFEVYIGAEGLVRVKGTTFDIKNVGSASSVVTVDEGHVEVQCGSLLDLYSGQQVTVAGGGFVTAVVAMQSAPNSVPKIPITNPDNLAQVPRVGPVNPNPAVQPTLPVANPNPMGATQFNWNADVGPLLTAGMTLAEGIDAVAARVGNPKVIQELAQIARGPLISADTRLSFSLRHSMPVRSALAWMARDVGARLEVGPDGRARLRLAGPDELPGAPESGDIPVVVQKVLKAPEHNQRLAARIVNASVALDEVAAASGVTIVADKSITAMIDMDLVEVRADGKKGAVRGLEAVLSQAHACAAWYDNCLYVAPAMPIEALTTVDRPARSIALLTGFPEQPDWTRAVLEIVGGQSAMPARLPRFLGATPGDADIPGYFDVAPGLIAKPAFSDVLVEDTDIGPHLRYRAGLFGDARMSALIKELERGSGPAIGASALTQLCPPGPIKDVQTLIEKARTMMPVESRIKNPAFNHQAFAVKNLSLGRVLEWGAWLQGAGVRPGPNGLVVDTFDTCYGQPALQVVTLTGLIDKDPRIANTVQAAMAKLLSQLYPTFFGKVEIKSFAGRIAFIGDRRQLQLANAVVNALDQELDERENKKAELDLATWRPAWRRDLDKNLAEPFKDDSAGGFNGVFAGVLRQSGFGLQFRHSVIVDLNGMQAHYGAPIDATTLDVTNVTVGQFIDRLAHAAGMRAVVEGDVVWIKP